MSVQALTWVIEKSRHKASGYAVMIAIANHAHADGTGAYPNIKTLAREARITERQVKRLLPILEASGELVVFWSNGRRSHEYAIAMGEKNSDILSRLKFEYMKKVAAANGDMLSLSEDALTVTSMRPIRDIRAASTRTFATAHIKEEPSLEPSLEKKEISPEQKAIWERLLTWLRKRLNRDVYNTWFKPIVFDGLDEDYLVRLRAGPVTVDWINLYYTELFDEGLEASGLEGFSIAWEKDDVNISV